MDFLPFYQTFLWFWTDTAAIPSTRWIFCSVSVAWRPVLVLEQSNLFAVVLQSCWASNRTGLSSSRTTASPSAVTPAAGPWRGTRPTTWIRSAADPAAFPASLCASLRWLTHQTLGCTGVKMSEGRAATPSASLWPVRHADVKPCFLQEKLEVECFTATGVILDVPPHPLTDGDNVTLSCFYRTETRRTPTSDFTANFYKNGVLLGSGEAGRMTLTGVSRSDEGLYSCEHPDGEESQESWLTVRGTALLSSPFICSVCRLTYNHVWLKRSSFSLTHCQIDKQFYCSLDTSS